MSLSSPGHARTESDLYPLVDAVYEAAVHPEAWPAFLAQLSAAVGAQSACLQIFDSASATGGALWSHGIPEEALANYPSWISVNPHLQAIAPYLRTGLVVSNTLVERSEFLKSEFFNGYGRLYFPTYAAAGGCVYRDGTTNVTIAVDRAVEAAAFDVSAGSVFSLLMPHLQRAMVVHKRLEQADLSQATSLDTLNHLDFGVILLSRDGRVVEMNSAARAMISGGDALKVTAQGRLFAAEERYSAALEGLLNSACNSCAQPLRASGGALLMGRRFGRVSLETMVSPIRLREFALTPNPPVAVMFLRDPERTAIPLARLQQIYGLTAAEARVAQRLTAGESVSDLSGSLHITVATARTHVRRLLGKVGAKSLSDLTRRIAGLPPLR